MQKTRRSADSVIYEPAKLFGQPLLGTGCLIDHATVPEGVYCYDYLRIGDRYLITSERDSQFAAGAVLLKNPLSFGKDGTLDAELIDLDSFMNELLVAPQHITEFLDKHTQTPGCAAPRPEFTQL